MGRIAHECLKLGLSITEGEVAPTLPERQIIRSMALECAANGWDLVVSRLLVVFREFLCISPDRK